MDTAKNHTRIISFLLTSIFLLVFSTAALAQAPQSIKYQAVARDNAGTLLANQSISLRLSIHEGSADGPAVYSESHSILSNGFGLITTNLGGGTPISGIFSSIDWGSGAKYVVVEMDPMGGTNYVPMGSSRMLSVPYALHAEFANESDPDYNQSAAADIKRGDIANWNKAFSWGNHAQAGYLTSMNLPMANPAPAAWAGIKQSVIDNWYTVLGWGDHSTAGYLKTESDPVYSAAPASGILSGDITNWNSAYGWGDHSLAGYLTSFSEVDPIYSTSPASGIFAGDITNWNTAFSWGDHALVGYLTSFTELDPIYNAAPASGILAGDIINWNTAFGWGDHAVVGYLTSFTEIDPIYSAAPASGILAADITNWNTAFGWGDHAVVGYLTSFTEVDPIYNAAPASGIFTGDITNWNTAFGWGDHSVVGYLTSFTELDPKVTSTTTNAVAKWDGTQLVDGTISDVAGDIGIGTTTPGAKLEVSGQVKITGGTPGAGKVLTSDAAGLASWATPATGGGGTLDAAYDHGGSGLGRTITADAGAVTVAGVDGFLALGTYMSGAIPATGVGVRMMWYPGKAAFRAGYVAATQWDDANVGLYSTAMGVSTTASGDFSTAMGRNSTASGSVSTAIGRTTTANGDWSTAMGYTTVASGKWSTAMGHSTIASAASSTAMGYSTTASDVSSTAMGTSTIASGDASTAMGYSTTASGDYSTAMGYDVTASGESSFATGDNTTASGPNSTAMGRSVSTNGYYGSFIIGDWIGAQLSSSAHNQMKMRFNGGYSLFTNNGGGGAKGVYMNGGQSGWYNYSDRNKKENFEELDGESLLSQLRKVPVTEWNYKGGDASIRYIGPMAQDFWQAFKLSGTDSLGINSICIDGVNMAAIKALDERTLKMQKVVNELQSLKNELAASKATNAAMQEELTAIRVLLEMQGIQPTLKNAKMVVK